jgi:hypothetical protein
MPFINKVAFSLSGLIVVCLAVLAFFTYAPDLSGDYLAVAAQNGHELRVRDFNCVSIRSSQVVYNQKNYNDPGFAHAVANVLSIENVYSDADAATCPWGLFVTGISGPIFAVRYNLWPALYLVSIGICERRNNERVDPDRCLSKNVYVFNRNVEPEKLFSLALKGLTTQQDTEWAPYRVQKGRL